MSSEHPTSNPAESEIENHLADEGRIARERREKAQKLKGQGINLYAQRFAPTHSAARVRTNQDALIASGETVVMAGRVLLIRSFGKAGFFTFLDQSGKFQAYIKKDVTVEAGYEFFNHGLDAGDIVGVEGKIFITKRGELTIEAHKLTLLTKSLLPLPEKWHGLKDLELRYRQRYVDFFVNPDVRETFMRRSAIVSTIRSMLDGKGYMEVETPMMQLIYGGASAKPFTTHHNALDLDLYLRIAPELFLKRLVVGGLEKVYEINRNFRNEGLSTRHNPEFTMLELYTAYWDYRDTMALTEELIRETARKVLGTTKIVYQGTEVELGEPFARTPILEAVAHELELKRENHGLRWGMEGLEELKRVVGNSMTNSDTTKRESIESALAKAESADEAILNLFEALVEPKIVRPTFVHDYPKSLCPLTKSAERDPAVAERFELFCCGLEIANAYSELNDPDEQLARFEEQVRRRAQGDEEAMSEADYDYVRALEYGMPPASGLGIGIDRLAMLLTDCPSIRDVILFPLMRPLPRGE